MLSFALAATVAGAQSPVAEQCTPAAGAGKSGDQGTVAVIAGQPILARELKNAVQSQTMALRNQEYQIESKALEDLIRQRVVEVEAKKQGLTVEQLYAKEVDSYVPTPKDAEVYAYYLGVRTQINKPFQDVKTQLQGSLKALEIRQLREDYINYLRAKTDISVMLQPPRVKVSFDRDRLRGAPDAPVIIVEFADYQCPYCEKVEASIQEIMKKYAGKVSLAFRDLPLSSIHPNAEKAAEAARCAGKQGKFWDFHDALFTAQAKLDEPGLKAMAHSIGLDEKAFAGCLESGELAKDVARDQEDGKMAGVTSTPGFFINGVFLSGAQAVGEFERIIDSELKVSARQAESDRIGDKAVRN